jgi:hypothetical protein
MLPFRVIQLEQYRALQQNAAKPCLPEFRYSELSLVAQSPSGPKLLELNRQILELERPVTCRKQTKENCSNRQKIQKRWPPIPKSPGFSSARDLDTSAPRKIEPLPTKNETVFQSGCTTSNRFWVKNRSDRKQTIKPCLTGSRFAHKDFQKSAKTNPNFGLFFAPISGAKSRGIS